MSLTEKCNLRCVYCMPIEGVQLTPRDELLRLEERQRTLRIFAHLGVNKIRFTGGEPTVSNQLKDLISYANDLKMKSIGITTNAVLLQAQLDDLVNAGLTSINISLDSLQPDVFEKITRRDKLNLYKVLSSMYRSIAKGVHVKVNFSIIVCS